MTERLQIVLIADAFPPQRTSAAVQLRDLCRELSRQGHHPTVLVPEADIPNEWAIEQADGTRVVRLKALRTKGKDYFRRTVGEFLMPFTMRRHLKKSPLSHQKWDGVVWYSPSIFHGPLAKALTQESGCKGYLILRDIFPQWAADVGLMSRGLAYQFFARVARYQYSVADTIGVQTPGNLAYVQSSGTSKNPRIEVLRNWLAEPANSPCSIRMENTTLSQRKVLVYAGNMGVAQGMDSLIDLAEALRGRADIGFLFVGRGSEASRLRIETQQRGLQNTLFFDEIDPDEIPNLYSQCKAGLLSLDPRHRSHNIPGKFLSYMQSGLPVLANINKGNDLVSLIRSARVGEVCESNRVEELARLAEQLLEQIESDHDYPIRCRDLFQSQFSVQKAANQIIAALTAQPTSG